MIAPLAVALVAIPVLVEHLGKDRFGILGIVGLLIGYLSVFDLGVGHAQAYLIATFRGGGEEEQVPRLFQTSLWVIAGLSLLLGGGLALSANALATRVFDVPPELIDEVRLSFFYAAGAIPFAILAPCLISTLEAYQEFKLINLVRIPTSASYLLAPLLVVPFTDTLPPVILAMIAGRVVECASFLAFCLRRVPGVFAGLRFDPALCKRLLSFGGWMTVTNLLLPLMIHGDRMILGIVGTLSMVTYYITPAELIVRLLVVPRALVTVLFPNFTMGYAGDTRGIPELAAQSIRLLLAAMTFGGAILIVIGPYALGLWLGGEFRGASGMILRWLTLGIVLLSLAYIPRFLIQASGKPRVTAILCLCEVPVYLGLALTGFTLGGATGIAAAWSIRCLIHMVSLYSFATPRLPGFAPHWRGLLPRFAGCLLFLTGLVFLPDPSGIPWNGLPIAIATALVVWMWVLHSPERDLILHPLRSLLKSNEGN